MVIYLFEKHKKIKKFRILFKKFSLNTIIYTRCIMDTRKEERLYGIKDLIIRDEGKEFNAILTSISKTGVSVIVDNIFPTYKEIEVKIGIEDGHITLGGSIRWVNDHKGEAGANLKEVGILFLDPPHEYIEYLDKLQKV